MEKFLYLPMDKQNSIINGALRTFGNNGYKKSSVSDIAEAAGISKAMVFHYFGTKKALYLYLVTMSCNLIMDEINDKFDSTITDFFDRIIFSSNIKVSVMKKHPDIISFLYSVYFETEEDVKEEIQEILSQGEDIRSKIAFDGVDTSKFKDGIDVKSVMKMLMWMAEGFVNNLNMKTEMDLDVIFEEFFECVNIMKKNFYKEEYL